MERKFSFPSMKGIKQAYSGLIKARDFIEVLKDNDGNMLTNIFEDNVRSFQGYNAVNLEIQTTVGDTNEQECFAVLNNGITIIAKKLEPIGDQIEIFDYQIVNGCQTSFVLFDNQQVLNENVYILAKLIEVNNEAILNRIIYTTNRQTEVKSEAFESSKPFHKTLEDYFNAIDIDYRLYYERRSKQYELTDTINKNKVVSLPSLIHAYIAVFLNEPHSTHRYYGELLGAYKSKLFIQGSHSEPYYISAYFSYAITNYIKASNLPTKYSRFKFHIACIMKNIVVGQMIDDGKSKQIKLKAKKLYDEYITDNNKLNDLIQTAISCLDEGLRTNNNLDVQTLHRTKEFTQVLLDISSKYSNTKNESYFLQSGNIVQCVIKSISKSFVNVELKTEDIRKNGSIHISEVDDIFISNLYDYFKIGDLLEVQILNDEYKERYGWDLSAKNNIWTSK